MTGPLHPSLLATLRELIGDVPPASDRAVADYATTVSQRHNHDHTRKVSGEDMYCSNLAGWLGERTGYLLSRLIAEGERTESRRSRLVALDNDAQNIRGLLAPDGAPRVVPMELGETLLPAVEWLVQQAAAAPATTTPTHAGQGSGPSDFFQVGHTYLRDATIHGARVRFQVAHVATAPNGFQHPQEPGPIAFGWTQRLDLFGDTDPQGAECIADFSGWTLDPNAEVIPQSAYRADYAGMTLGTYTTREVAQQHCERDLTTNVDTEDRPLHWVPFSEQESEDQELYLGKDGDQEVTGYSVYPIELQTAYDPTAES